MKLVRAVGALGLAGIAAVSAQAGAADEGYYLGAGIGQSWEKNHHDRITQQLRGSGFSTTSIDDDSRDTAWKLLGGKKFNKNFAVEASYFNLGEFGFTAHTAPPGTLTGNINTLMVGLVYMFGGKAAPRAAEAPPAVLAAAPIAEPVLVIVPIVAKTEQYCSILDIQFEINQKTVQHASEEKMNKVGRFMNK